MKFLKVSLIVLLVLFVSILSVPLIFKTQLMDIAKKEVNNNVNAHVEWSKFSVSLFKGFPDLKISMDDVSVRGKDLFEKDTLVAFDQFSVKINLLSAFSGKINVQSIILDNPVINAIVQEEGVNWDITYPSEEIIEETDTSSSSMSMEINLKEFLINNASISYFDIPGSVYARLDNFNLSLSGNFSENITELNLNTFADQLSLDFEGIKYLNKASISLSAILNADLENMSFELSDNLLKLNDLQLGLEGVIKIPEQADADVDVRFFSKETSFKTLLSMIPAVYMKDFEDLKTSGQLKIEGNAKGLVKDNILPKVNLNLKVSDAFIAYPDLPESIKNINIDFDVFYDGVDDDNSKLDLNNFHLEMAGNPIDLIFHVRTPVSDMQMNGSIAANIDLSSLENAIPLEEMKLQGKIISDIEIMGKMSDIENENYEDFNAKGSLQVNDMILESGELPVAVNIKEMKLLFTPRYVNLENFDAIIGESDLHMDGKLENFIPYVFKEAVILGKLNLSSSYLNINQLIGSDTTDIEDVEDDTLVLELVEVPKNIDFVLQTKLNEIVYDNLNINDLKGIIWIKDGVLRMDKLDMNLLNGSMMLDGEYNTQDIFSPFVDMSMDMETIDIQSAATSFNSIEKLMPVAKMCHGDVSLNFDFTSAIDSAMSPILSSISGKGSLQTDEIKLEDNETFSKIGKMLKKPDLADQKFKDINIFFEVKDGRIYVEPFDTKLGSSDLKIGGSQGLDQTINYDLGFSIPRSQFGNTANDLLENFSAQAKSKGFELDPGENVNVGIKLKGTFKDPKLDMDIKENLSGTKTQVKKAVKQKLDKEVDKAKEEIQQSVNYEVDKIMKEADQQAEEIKETAKKAGESLIGEAQLRKKDLLKEAGSNPLKKLAAEKAGNSLVKSAKKQAENIQTKADEKADVLLKEAEKKANAIKNK